MTAVDYAVLSGARDPVPTRPGDACLIEGILGRVEGMTIVTTGHDPRRYVVVPTAKPPKGKKAQWKRELKGRRP